MRVALVVAQAATFFGLGAYLVAHSDWKLGAAQVLLGLVTILVYSA